MIAEGGIGRGLESVNRWLTAPLFQGAPAWLNSATILALVFYVVALVWVSAWIRRLLVRRLLPRMHVDPGQAYALGTMIRYAIVVFGVLIVLQTRGVDLSSVSVLFGALGVGVGFSLQAVTSNFFSGLVILLERPLQVGDRIQMGDLNGRVTRIRLRATEILTNDEIMVIVPNTEFIVHQVVNWSRGGNRMRVHVPVGVAHDSDLAAVRTALLEAAASVPTVLTDPPPGVRLVRFGESSIDFELLCWTREMLHRPMELKSRVGFAVHASLEKHGISIPFAQREVRLSTKSPMKVEIARTEEAAATASSGPRAPS